MTEPTLRAAAIDELERILAWLENDEPLVFAGWKLAALSLKLMGRKPH